MGGDVFRNEYSLEFDGSNDYVEIPNDSSLALTNDFTLACWCKPTSVAGAGMRMIDRGTVYYLDWDSTSDKFSFITYSSANRIMVADNTSAINTWHHIVGTTSGASGSREMKFYINGVPALADFDIDLGSAPNNANGSLGDVEVSTASFFIGKYDDGQKFTGNIDEVAIWNTALSSNQVKTLYNNREPFNAKNIALSSLKAYYRMGDGHLDTFSLIADQVNPTLGSEIWDTDSSTFTVDGTHLGSSEETTDCYGWEKIGTNTIANVSGELRIAYGNDAAGAKSYFRDTGDLNDDLDLTTVYRLQFDAYADTDTNVKMSSNYFTWESEVFTTVKTTFVVYFLLSHLSAEHLRLLDFSEGNVFIDNLSLKPVNGNAGLMTSMASDDIVTDTH